MADVRSAWNETGDKLTDLGRKLKVHYDSQHGGEHQATRDELTAAARKLGAAVQDAFEAIGSAARDKAVQEDVKQVGQSLADALGATLGQAADEVRRAFSERKGPRPPVPASGGAEGEASAPATLVDEPGPAGAAPDAPPSAGTGAEPGTASGGAATGDEPGNQPPKVEPWGTP